jgi:hypothetical protein
VVPAAEPRHQIAFHIHYGSGILKLYRKQLFGFWLACGDDPGSLNLVLGAKLH